MNKPKDLTPEQRREICAELQKLSLMENVELTLKNLTELRDKLAGEFEQVPQPTRWRGQLQIQSPVSWIIHLMRRENADGSIDEAADAASVARALKCDGEWHRYGSQWQCGYSHGTPFITVMIHGAQPERPSPEVVNL